MRRKSLLFTSILLVISIGSLTRIIAHSQIRAVDFIAIMAVGILTGVLIMQVVLLLKKNT